VPVPVPLRVPVPVLVQSIPSYGPCGVDALRPRMLNAVLSLGEEEVQALLKEQGTVGHSLATLPCTITLLPQVLSLIGNLWSHLLALVNSGLGSHMRPLQCTPLMTLVTVAQELIASLLRSTLRTCMCLTAPAYSGFRAGMSPCRES